MIELTARLLNSLAHHTDGHALLQELLPAVLPWARFLPAADRHILVQEFIDVTEAATSIDNMSPIAQLLIEWRHTAEVHADPELHALLSTPRGEDHGRCCPLIPRTARESHTWRSRRSVDALMTLSKHIDPASWHAAVSANTPVITQVNPRWRALNQLRPAGQLVTPWGTDWSSGVMLTLSLVLDHGLAG